VRPIGVLLAPLALLPFIATANLITDENARPGATSWRLAAGASMGIEGYASSTSIGLGDTIRFYVNTADPTYTIEIFRMGWYNGAGARRVTDAVERSGAQQQIPSPDPSLGLIECHWVDPYVLTLPFSGAPEAKDWLSGIYLARLTAKPSGNQNFIIFAVHDERPADLFLASAFTTSEAYNNWGGKSLYSFNSTNGRAFAISFDRPFSSNTGATEFFRYEYPMIRFLEREGYDVTYGTSIDLHANAQRIRRARAYLSVGHDEYWSWEMRQNVEAARDAGVNLGFFSGNVCYWQIRLQANAAGDPNRTMLSYKEDAFTLDPFARDGDPTNDSRITTRWRNVPGSSAEEAMIGVMWTYQGLDSDIIVERASHWVFANTNLQPGDHLIGLLGYEVDRIFGIASPPGLVRLARSPFAHSDGTADWSDMTIYEAASGAQVFAAGSIQWSWGVDDFSAVPSRVSPAAQQITRNVFARFTQTSRRRSVRH
jgi:hypothetical protein